MTTAQALALLHGDDHFVYSKRFNFSIEKLEERYPDVVPDRVIAAVMMITEDDVEAHYQRITRELQQLMGVDPDSL